MGASKEIRKIGDLQFGKLKEIEGGFVRFVIMRCMYIVLVEYIARCRQKQLIEILYFYKILSVCLLKKSGF